jgi:hypothetical protein
MVKVLVSGSVQRKHLALRKPNQRERNLLGK